MSLRVMTWFYRKLGSLYPAAFVTVELQSALVVTAATVGLFTFYYDADGDQFLHALLAALALTALAIGSDFGLAERPGVTLKGIDEPMTLYAPAVPDRVPEAGDGHAESLGRVPPARALGNRPGPTHTL